MRHDRFHEDEDSGQDSFLDVVANVVGVLIILVMLVGVRASHSLLVAATDPPATPAEASLAENRSPAEPQDLDALREQLDEADRQARKVDRENEKLTVKLVKMAVETDSYERRRAELAMHRAVIEDNIENRRGRLDSSKQQQFDVQRQLLEAQIQLDEMAKEHLTLATAPTAAEEIECVPTPIAKIVEGDSIHLRLHKGLVSIVPLEELLGGVESRVDDIRRRLQSRNEVVETVGPINGYRLRFTVTKRIDPGSIGGPRVGHLQRSVHEQFAQVLPVSNEIGQNVEQSLMPGSKLYERLHSYKRQMPAVVVWLYTDSFKEFRPLKRALWEQGVSVAVRPMQKGALIGASPNGTKSAAQ